MIAAEAVPVLVNGLGHSLIELEITEEVLSTDMEDASGARGVALEAVEALFYL